MAEQPPPAESELNDDTRNLQTQKSLFNAFNVGIGCFGLIGILIALITLVYTIAQPTQVIIALSDIFQVTITPVVIIATQAPTIPPEDLPTQTPFIVTATSDSVKVAEEEPVATNTPRPTSTPRPTTTPDAALLFEDDFEDGLSDGWSIESGVPLVVDGVLTAGTDSVLTVGDTLWTNYRVEFDYDGSCDNNVLRIRYTDSANFYALVWDWCGSEWYLIVDGEEIEIPETYVNRPGAGKYVIEVRDNLITMDYRGNRANSFRDNTHSQGFVWLFLRDGDLIDNFRVFELLSEETS